ncbi:MAG: AsmA-like C-terminal region-containing protein [Microbacter sp.]
MRKSFMITASVILAFMVILLVLPFAFSGKINTIVKQEANKKLNAVFNYESLHLNLFRNFPNATVEINDVSIKGIDRFKNDTLLTAKSFRVVINLMSLFGNKGYEVSKIALDQPIVHAVIDQNGLVNWDIVKSDTTKQTTSSPFHIRLKNVSVKSAVIYYIDYQAHQQMVLNDFSGSLSGDFTSDLSNLKTQCHVEHLYFDDNKVRLLSNAKADLKATIEANFQKEIYSLKNNELKINDVALQFDGWVAVLKEGYRMNLKLVTPLISFKSLLSLIPSFYTADYKSLQADGKVSLTGSLNGLYSQDSIPSFRFSVSLSNGRMQYAQLKQPVTDINLQLIAEDKGNKLSQATIAVPRFHFVIGHNPFDFTGFFSDLQGNTNFKMTLAGLLDLSNVRQFYPPAQGISLSGTISANLAASGTMAAVKGDRYNAIQASGSLQVNQLTYQSNSSKKLSIPKAVLTFNQNSATLSQLSLLYGKSDLNANGKVDNILPYVMSGQTIQGALKLSSNYLDLNEWMGASSSKTTSAATAFQVPKNIDFDLISSLKQVFLNTFDFRNVLGEVSIKDGILTLNHLQTDFLGGQVSMNGNYNTAIDPTKPSVDFTLQVQDANFFKTYQTLDIAKKLAPIFSHIQGSYHLNMSMKTDLDRQLNVIYKTFNAQGLLTSHNISVGEIPALDALSNALKTQDLKKLNVKDISIPFTITDGLVRTPPFDLKVAGYALTLGGTTGLDQSIQYQGKISLPSHLSSPLGVPISNLPFQLYGTFSQPKVKLDMNALGKEMVSGAVTKAINAIAPSGVVKQADMEQRINQIRADAKAKSDALLQEAQNRANQLISQAKNPFAKMAAQKVADKIMNSARKQAEDVLSKAESEVQKLQNQ